MTRNGGKAKKEEKMTVIVEWLVVCQHCKGLNFNLPSRVVCSTDVELLGDCFYDDDARLMSFDVIQLVCCGIE